MVTKRQVQVLRWKLMEGKTREAAAAAAGMSVPTARKWASGALPLQEQGSRHWRTRVDPFAGVWEQEIVALLERDVDGVLEGTTIFEELDRRYPGRFAPGQLRTLQRRIRDWRALYGPDKEVFFEQVHEPGREAAGDFTHCDELGVTVQGEPLDHLLFELTLSYSKRTWANVAFGETYEALVDGMQRALGFFGGVPAVIRLDNLSAATHELRRSGGCALNTRFAAVLDHYGMASSLITPGRAHENGVVEQRHFRTKRALEQALLLRGSKEFESVTAYEKFVTEVIERSHNRHTADAFAIERQHLRALPSTPVPSYTVFEPVVRRWSTVRIGSRVYSVPSRLIGHTVHVRQHPDVVEVYYRGKLVQTMPRLRGHAEHRIDYRHISGSLARKPGAFARYRYREELFPSLAFRQAYDRLCTSHGERADVEYVRILHLAATTMQSRVDQALRTVVAERVPFDYAHIQELVDPQPRTVPNISIGRPDLSVYDGLLAGGAL